MLERDLIGAWQRPQQGVSAERPLPLFNEGDEDDDGARCGPSQEFAHHRGGRRLDRRAARRQDDPGRRARLRGGAGVGARPGRRARLGAGGLPARLGLVRAVFDRPRRTGRSRRAAADGRQPAGGSRRAASPTRSTRWPSPERRCASGSRPCRPRSWPASSSICGCWSIIASGSFASAPRWATTFAGTCTTSGPNSRSRRGRCSARKWLGKIARRLARAQQTARVRIARDELRRIAELTRAIDALEREIAELVARAAPQLLDRARLRTARPPQSSSARSPAPTASPATPSSPAPPASHRSR